MSEKVNLLIRSALCNADSKIEAALDWTVLEVKKQIEKIWPSNPPPGDQRLVYAGKLLQDPSKLQDVLRMEDLGQPFIVHLVCRQLSPPPASSRSSTDGLRRRPNVPSPTASSSNAQASSQTSAPVNAGVNSPWMQSYDGQVTAVDQAIAMQQMYAHYVNQYMQYLQTAGNSFGSGGLHHWNTAVTTTNVVHDPRQAEAAPNNVLEPIAAAAAAAVAGGQAVAAAGHNVQAADANIPAAMAVQGGQAADVAAANVGPNPPNVVLNANAGGLGAIEDDDDGGAGGQRDILDWFYVASRVLVLFSIVYFYSSLARFALVAGVGLVLYLYQIGFFGQPRGPHHHNNNINNNNPVARPQEQDLIRQQVDEVRQAAGGGGDDETGHQPQEEEVNAPEVVSPNYISVAATFVTSFFSSLIPHEPQVV